MTRALSSKALASMMAEQTDAVWLILLTIDHDDLDAPIRVVNNSEDIVSNAETFIAFPFALTLPEDAADRLPQVKLTIDVVDQRIIEAVRTLTSPPEVTVQVVLAEQPDVIELEIADLTLRDVDYDDATLTGTLMWEDILSQSYPAPQYLPGTAAGLF